MGADARLPRRARDAVNAGAVGSDDRGPLVLGPMLRYIGETDATVWVETSGPGVVTVHADGREWAAPTFAVKGHHYALVVVDGLEPGGAWRLRGAHRRSARLAAEPDSAVSRRAAHRHPRPRSEPTRLAFGSCRTSVPARRGRATATTGSTPCAPTRCPGPRRARTWPDLVLFLGDQVYADETSQADARVHRRAPQTSTSRRARSSRTTRSTPTSTSSRGATRPTAGCCRPLPSAMIFDDHDIRDDWNTSWTWQRGDRTARRGGTSGSSAGWRRTGSTSTSATSRPRTLARGRGLAADRGARASRAERRARPDRGLWTTSPSGSTEHPETYRWSYARDLGDTRLVVVDSRAARVLEPTRRSMLDDDEMAWLDGQLRGDVEHLLIGTSLPFLLPPGPARPRGDGTRRSPRAPGARASRGVARRSAVPSTSSTGRRSTTASSRCFEMVMQVAGGERGRRRRASRSCPATSTTPTSPRSSTRGAHGAAPRDRPGGLLTDPQPDAADGPGHDVVVRARARAAHEVRGRALEARPRARPTPGRSPTGRGSTTASPS